MGPQTAGTALSTQAREAAVQLCWTDGAEGQQVKDYNSDLELGLQSLLGRERREETEDWGGENCVY